MIRTALAITAIVCVLATGCAEYQAEAHSPLAENASEYVLTILVDMSGSFAAQMAENGNAYAFTMQVVDRYFRDRIGMPDQLIIAQLSGNDRPLLWQGTPRQLREDFPDADSFRQMLRSKANENGSRIHLGLAESLEYVMSDSRVANSRAKSAVFVLSDMIDNMSHPQDVKQRVLEDLSKYGRCGGSIGMFYVDQSLVPGWRRYLEQSGIKHWCVQSEIVSQPQLPSFD